MIVDCIYYLFLFSETYLQHEKHGSAETFMMLISAAEKEWLTQRSGGGQYRH